MDQVKRAIGALETHGEFYEQAAGTYVECLKRAKWFKGYIENQDGYKLINRAGQPFSRESEVQLFFGLIWYGTEFDVNREVNNGRGPVDFEVSDGSVDKTLIEFKLGSNTGLKRNLEKQVAIYEAANEEEPLFGDSTWMTCRAKFATSTRRWAHCPRRPSPCRWRSTTVNSAAP